MNTLADFKRYLATPNARVRMISFHGQTPNPALAEWRTVAKLQTNAVAFATANNSGKSWLEFGKASGWTFDGNTVSIGGLVYEIGAENA
jgi:hypothetical protein